MSKSAVSSFSTWQEALSQAVTDPAELFALLNLDPDLLPGAKEATQLFPLRVPHSFIARMEKGTIHDPLLMQILPLGVELVKSLHFSSDPLQEKKVNPVPGLLHKYQGRVLLTTAGVCGVNCRYCFRREFAYRENTPSREGWKKALAYIAADTTINEVILSGGDPLIASDAYLGQLVEGLQEIQHVNTLRIHSRMPIVLPERINQEMLAWFAQSRLKPVMVLHCNHPNEIDSQVVAGLELLKDARVTLLNQAVILKGINDSSDVLIKLSQKLFAAGVLPYYLHMLDKVQGSAHFEVSEAEACRFVSEMARSVPGYLVPRLVKEVPGAPAKTPIHCCL